MDWTERRFHVAIVIIAILAGIVVYVIGHEVFPYLSLNHDEGVYLQQASMLLHGKLWLTSELPKVFQPWFFIRDGHRLYPKYTPVSALMFAPSLALGIPRLSLSLIAVGNVALVGLIGREAFDRPTGVLAAGFALATPFFLFVSATFMSYAPTTLLNLLFAFAYIRMHRRGGWQYGAIAGAAIGMAFFSRPYTAVLFAVPFVIHALVAVWHEIRKRNIWTPTIEREVVVALFGFGGVCIALAYNYVMTGNPFLFPYKVFAPHDGLGFGYHSLTAPPFKYTVERALWANLNLFVELLTRWTVAAPIGSALAAIGLLPVALHYRERNESPLPDYTLRLVLIGVFVTVIVGNIYFWGTYNILGGIRNPTDGFMAHLGPYYHLDLVLPLSVFAGAGVVWLARMIRSAVSMHTSTQAARAVLIVLLVVSVPIVASAEYNRVEPVIDRNMEYTEQYSEVYAPFENTTFEHALVFLPLPYDGWLGHPFQSLRNGGSLEQGDVLFAQNLGPAKQFATIDEFPNRTPYRFTYRGVWGSGKGHNITPHLQRLTIYNGTHFQLTTTIGDVGKLSSIRLSVGDRKIVRYNYYQDESEGNGTVTVQWALNGTQIRLVNVRGATVTGTTTYRNPLTGHVVTRPTTEEMSPSAISIDGSTYASLSITFTKPNGKTVTYRQGIAIDANNESVRFLWPGPTKLCLESRFCGYEELYVPGAEYPKGVSMNTTVRSNNTTRAH
jgi:hypothetical protein